MQDSGEREPMSVVWTTLPWVSFIFPPIGHIGISDSEGVTFDFSGPFQVTKMHLQACRSLNPIRECLILTITLLRDMLPCMLR